MKLFGLELNKASSVTKLREDLQDVQRVLEDVGWIKINGSGEWDAYSILKDSYENMVKRSRLAFIKNPIVGQAVNLTTNYTFGDGIIEPKSIDEEVQKIVTDFWKNPDNILSFTGSEAQMKLSNKLQYDGELAFTLQVDVDGTVYVRLVDPLSISKFIKDSTDEMRNLFYKRRINNKDQFIPDFQNGLALMREFNGGYDEEWQAMLKKHDVKESDILPNTYLFHVKHNNDILDTRGIPMVYRALDWINSNSKINSDTASFINAQSQYAWKKKIKGTRSQIDAMQARGRQNTQFTNPSNMAGSTYLHNDGVEMEAIGLPGSSGTLFETGIRRTLLMVCAAFGIMEHYFGDPSTGNLATSKSMELPMLKKFLALRKIWESIYNTVLQFQLDTKLMALSMKSFSYIPMKNRLAALEGRDYATRTVDIDFPPILEKDIKEMATAMGEAKQQGLIPIETAQRLFMQSVGINNIDDELKKEFSALPEPPLTGGGGGGNAIGESVRNKQTSVQINRGNALKLAEKNKEMLRKLSGYKASLSDAYTSYAKAIKENLSTHQTASGKFSAQIKNVSHAVKIFEVSMLKSAQKYYPEVVSLSEKYARQRLKLKESSIVLFEKKMDVFVEDQLKWNSDFVRRSLAPALKEKLAEMSKKNFESEADAAAYLDEVLSSSEARVGLYVGALWTVAERAVKEASKGSDQKANFVGVEDDKNCTGCSEAIDGNPWSVDDIPIPGEQDCLSNCRHAIQLMEDDSLNESDIQLLRDAEQESKAGFRLLK